MKILNNERYNAFPPTCFCFPSRWERCSVYNCYTEGADESGIEKRWRQSELSSAQRNCYGFALGLSEKVGVRFNNSGLRRLGRIPLSLRGLSPTRLSCDSELFQFAFPTQKLPLHLCSEEQKYRAECSDDEVRHSATWKILCPRNALRGCFRVFLHAVADFLGEGINAGEEPVSRGHAI